MYTYEIHKIINNPDENFGYQPCLDSLGETMIVGDQILPDFSNGNPRTSSGSAKVYQLKYDSYMHLKSMNQMGSTLVGTTDENLGKMVSINRNGRLVCLSSDTHLFKIFSYNLNSADWELLYTPGTSHAPPTGQNVGGFRVDSELNYIVIAFVDYSNGNTTIRFYRRNGNTWTQPAYTLHQNFQDRFGSIRGLWMSDAKTVDDYPTPIVVHIESIPPPGQSENLVYHITALKENSFDEYGTITTYDSNGDYGSLASTISKDGSHIAISYYNNTDNKVYATFYSANSASTPVWTLDHTMSFTPQPGFTMPLSTVRLSNSLTGNLPERFCLSAAYGLSTDSMYGIYQYNSETNVYDQKSSFTEKISELAGGLPVINGFVDAAISDDLDVVATTFIGMNENNSPPLGPIHHASVPQPGVHASGVGNFENEGMGLVVFVRSSPTPDPPDPAPLDPLNPADPSNPSDPTNPTTPNPNPTVLFGLTTSQLTAAGIVGLVMIALLFLIFM
jgi:hypothetical protein